MKAQIQVVLNELLNDYTEEDFMLCQEDFTRDLLRVISSLGLKFQLDRNLLTEIDTILNFTDSNPIKASLIYNRVNTIINEGNTKWA